MAAEIFVDTSAWYPIAVPNHPDHEWLADALTKAIRGGRRVVTTNLIMAETHAVLMSRVGPPAAMDFLRAVRKSPNVVVHATPDLEDRAITNWAKSYGYWELYENHERYGDLERYAHVSLADMVSYEVIRERGIREVLGVAREEWVFQPAYRTGVV